MYLYCIFAYAYLNYGFYQDCEALCYTNEIVVIITHDGLCHCDVKVKQSTSNIKTAVRQH